MELQLAQTNQTQAFRLVDDNNTITKSSVGVILEVLEKRDMQEFPLEERELDLIKFMVITIREFAINLIEPCVKSKIDQAGLQYPNFGFMFNWCTRHSRQPATTNSP